MTTVRCFVKGKQVAMLILTGQALRVEHFAADGDTKTVDEYTGDELPEVVEQLQAAGYEEISEYAADVVPGVRPLAGAELDAACEVTPAEQAEIRAGLIPELGALLDATPAGKVKR